MASVNYKVYFMSLEIGIQAEGFYFGSTSSRKQMGKNKYAFYAKCKPKMLCTCFTKINIIVYSPIL